jgi:acyl-CoA thioesterase I
MITRWRLLFVLSTLLGLLAPALGQTRIVALGASQVAGYGVGAAAAFPAQLEALLKANGHDVTVLNAGNSGDTSAQVLARLDSAVPAGTSVVLLGAFIFNDHRTGISPATSGANMAMIESRLRAEGVSIIRVSFQNLPPSSFQADKVHLNRQGHALMAQRLLPQVTALLGAK